MKSTIYQLWCFRFSIYSSKSKPSSKFLFNRRYQLVVFNNGPKMALRAPSESSYGHLWSKTLSAPSFGIYWKQTIGSAYHYEIDHVIEWKPCIEKCMRHFGKCITKMGSFKQNDFKNFWLSCMWSLVKSFSKYP